MFDFQLLRIPAWKRLGDGGAAHAHTNSKIIPLYTVVDRKMKF